MRLKTAQNYISLLNEGHAPMSYAQGSKLRLNATTEGIGPIFKINLEIQNLSKKTLVNTRVMISFDKDIYRVINKSSGKAQSSSHKPIFRPEGSFRFDVHPLLLPNITYKQKILGKFLKSN